MRKKKEYHEEHPDESWLIPYGDMLTLLLALFIVMFAMSTVDKEKFKSVSESFNAVLGGSSLLENDGSKLIPLEESNESGSSGLTNTQIEENAMSEIKSSIEEKIASQGYSDKVNVGLSNEGLEISIQDVVLFNSGEADILAGVSPLLVQVSNVISSLDNEIKIVGHSDNVPIKNEKFRSNWDLSAMRAVNVMNFMVTSGKIRPEKVSIQAYGEYKPKVPNTSEASRSKNRRVEIFIVRQYPASTERNE